MTGNESRRSANDRDYQEFARKMTLFEEGPTTTQFEQLTSAGVELPDPDAIADVDVRPKLWQVLAELANVRTYLDQTNHLGDRELYATLWRGVLREDVPAIDEIGFNHCVNLLSNGGSNETLLYLEILRRRRGPATVDEGLSGLRHAGACGIHLYNRDCLLPRPDHEPGPEAREWLGANWSASALAGNRFQDTAQALTFVEQLYAAGARHVRVDDVMFRPNLWTPYTDTLIVDLPTDHTRRSALFELMEGTGQPDEHDRLGPLLDSGQESVRLWWD